MLVKNVMTKRPKIIKSTDNIKKVVQMLHKHNINGCPVVDYRGNVVGMITRSDILKTMDVHSKVQTDNFMSLVLSIIKSETYDGIKESLKRILDMKVKDFIEKRAVTVEEDDDLYRAVKIMTQYDIECLPVLKEKKLTGVVSRADVVAKLDNLGKK